NTDYAASSTVPNFLFGANNGSILFPANSTSVDITVTSIDDNIFDPNENIQLSLAPSTNYILGTSRANVNITDNDTRGIAITSIGTNPGLAEGGNTKSYTVALRSQPIESVIFTIRPDEQTELGLGAGIPFDLNFTPKNWSSPQTFTIKAVDDRIAEGPHSGTIASTISSADPNYDGTVPLTLNGVAGGNIPATKLTLPIADNDTPAVKITRTGGTTKIGEGDISDTYTVELTTEPTASVTVSVSPDAQSDVGAGGGSTLALTFTPLNWNTPQVVTLQAVDDAIVEANPHTTKILHKATSADPKYNLIAIPAVIAEVTDNDNLGFIVTPELVNVAEGGETGSYKLALSSKPTAPVKINFKTGFQIDSISSFTFTSNNWNIPQIVTVKATDDTVVEGLHTATITHNIDPSSAAEYKSVAIAPVIVLIADNDTASTSPAVTVTQIGGSTNAAEGGATGSYRLSLNIKPTANVTVNFAAGSQINAIAPIVFTPVNWNAPQTVTVTATDDTVVEGTHTGTINHSVAAGSAAEYLPVAIAPVTVSITDNDIATSTAGVKISPTSTTAAEGGANGSYSAVLTSQPSSDVKVSFATDSQIEAIASFTFTSANWNLPQTATVKAVDDSAVEGTQLSTIAASAFSTDLAYNKIGISKIDVLILDNDSPGIAVTPNSTNAAEGFATGSYSIVLTKAPTAPVTVNFAAGSQINAIAPIVFTPVNWNAPQTVTVTATDDTVVEGTHSGIISHSVAAGSAAEYLPVAIAPVSVTITDNDTATTAAGVTVTQTGGSTIVAEGGTTDTYQVVLNSQPSSDVKVSFATDSQIDAIASFTFTSANWNLPQTATVKAVDDSAAEGTHLSTIASSATSTDLAYNNIGIPKVDVLILDNDIPGIAVTPTSTNAAEGGATGSYSVVLTKAPTANVTVNFAAGSQIDAIAPIVFTPVNWNAAQTVTVKATDDSIVEGTHTGLIFSSVAPGSAAEYLPVAIAPVTVTIADNDIAPPTPTPTPVINFSPTIIVPTPTP
ncbi:Calx-beta domain-containing protein, partial [Microcoleus sp. herbarium14]|uniref:Calx-beta domain-containing protein n=1 Tax=Microcoleus sp. herbarium14 TaxID=3055439 RepID=UPI002FD53773